MPIISYEGKYYVIKANGKYYDLVNLFKTYTLTITPTPSDATVVLTADGYTQEGNSITVIEGTTVNWTVSKNNYFTQSGTIEVNEDTTQSVSLVYSLATLYIEPVPNDATVVLTADGYTQVGNGITVEKGTVVYWTVSKDGYIARTGSQQVNNDESLDIELEVEGPLYYCYKYSVYGDTFYYFSQQPTQLKSYYCCVTMYGPARSTSDLSFCNNNDVVEIGSNYVKINFGGNIITANRYQAGDLYT